MTFPTTATAKSLQLCPTLCDPIDGSPPGSPVPGILQARTLEWVAISFSNTWKWKVKVKSLSTVWLLATPWTAAHQAPPSMGFSRQEYWSGLPFRSPTSVWVTGFSVWIFVDITLFYLFCYFIKYIKSEIWKWYIFLIPISWFLTIWLTVSAGKFINYKQLFYAEAFLREKKRHFI